MIAEENPEASDGELIKLSMKQWRSLSDDERSQWNDKMTGTGGNTDDKKRKREIMENNENDKKITNVVNEKSMKKLKSSDSDNTSKKLAGFTYSKN